MSEAGNPADEPGHSAATASRVGASSHVDPSSRTDPLPRRVLSWSWVLSAGLLVAGIIALFTMTTYPPSPAAHEVQLLRAKLFFAAGTVLMTACILAAALFARPRA